MRGRARAPRSARFGPKLSWDTSKGRAVGAGRLDVVDALARSIRVEGDRYAAGELTGDVRAPLSDGHPAPRAGAKSTSSAALLLETSIKAASNARPSDSCKVVRS